MPNIGPVELVIILVIALLVIGPGKLPDVGAALGKSIREFRKAATDVQESVKIDTPPTTVTPAPAAPAVQVAAPAAAAQPAPAEATTAPTAPVPNTLAAQSTPNELGVAAAPGPAATTGDGATEAKV
jgi:TatA/E family protein of Tat protein translocase